MLLVFCLSIILVCTYYTRSYLKRRANASKTPNKNKENYKMSDNEFADPSGAENHWKKQNQTPTQRSTGVFQWKRQRTPEVKGVQVEKRQRFGAPQSDVIILTDDDDDDSINNSDVKVVSNATSVETIEIHDSNNTDEKSTSVIEPNIAYHDSPSKKDLTMKAILKKLGKKSSVLDTPLPPGMPPMIAGVPVKFPISPYRSQISVMNAIIKGCKNAEHCLLESPTGSGKTLALLCAGLAWQEHFKANLLKEAMEESKNFLDPGAAAAAAQDQAAAQCQPGTSDDCKKSIVEDPEMDSASKNDRKIPKIFYGSRTHKQIEQVVREFKKTAYANMPMTILSSRELTCIQTPVKGVSKTQLCNDYHDPQKKKGCEYNSPDVKKIISSFSAMSFRGFETPWDIEDLVQFGEQNCACPYFAARNMMTDADIIFCPYNYLIDPVIRNSMAISLKGHIVIVDEAHNIESICRDVGGAEFREDHLGEAIEDCTLIFNQTNPKNYSYETILNYLTRFVDLMLEQVLKKTSNFNSDETSNYWNGEEIWTLFKVNDLGGMQYVEFHMACQDAIRAYKEVKEGIADGEPYDLETKKRIKKKPAINYVTVRLLEELMLILDSIQLPQFNMDYRCFITKSYHKDAKVKVDNSWTSSNQAVQLRTFKFLCMNSGIVFERMAREARCVVLASGTLSPTSTFESELGIKFAHKLHANHVIAKDQVYIRGIPHGPKGTMLKATYSNTQTLPFKDDLGGLILEVCSTVPHGVLCFFSSYAMMMSQMDRWRETGLWQKMTRHKHILTEPRSNVDLDEVMRVYRDTIKSTCDGPSVDGITGALLFAVFRGKVAEGIDFSDNEARCVLTIGIPYAVQTDPAVKLKSEYNDLNKIKKGLLSGREWYSVQAYRALNQALGRCIRHRNDWGAVLLVDERLLSDYSASYLPKWIREMKLQGVNYNLKEELNDFVKRQKVRDEERNSSEKM